MIKDNKILKKTTVDDLLLFVDLVYRKEIILSGYKYTISDIAIKEYCNDIVNTKEKDEWEISELKISLEEVETQLKEKKQNEKKAIATIESRKEILMEFINIYNEYILEWITDVLFTSFNEIYLQSFFKRVNKDDLLLKQTDITILTDLKIIHTVLSSYLSNIRETSELNDSNYILTSKDLLDIVDILLNHLDHLKDKGLKNSNNEIVYLIKELFMLLLDTSISNNKNNISLWNNVSLKILDSFFLFWNDFYIEFLENIDDYIDFTKKNNHTFLKNIEINLRNKSDNIKYANNSSKSDGMKELLDTNDIMDILAIIKEIKTKYKIKTDTKVEDVQSNSIDETYIELYKNRETIKNNLKSSIIGQDNIIDKITDIYLPKLFLGINKRPISIIFAWDSWLWKTELWKQLWIQLGHKSLHIPMGNYQQEHMDTWILWAPPSYVWYGEPTILEKYLDECDEQWKIPVIIFDEIEKWHPSLQNMYLEIFDEWKITFLSWKVKDLSKAVIIMTSNLGINDINKKSIWFGVESDEDNQQELNETTIKKAVSTFFKKEILNRISDICVFNTLSKWNISDIIDNTIKWKIENIENNSIIKKIFGQNFNKISISKIKKELKKEVELNNIENIRKIEHLAEKIILDILEN